jgi:hypothetical protein
MTVNLRRCKDENNELYVNVGDLLKMIRDVILMDGMHPEHIRALDGFGTGLALSLNAIKIEDLPNMTRELLEKRMNGYER